VEQMEPVHTMHTGGAAVNTQLRQPRPFGRRAFLVGALSVSSAGLLAACGGSAAVGPTSAPVPPTAAPAVKPTTAAAAPPATAPTATPVGAAGATSAGAALTKDTAPAVPNAAAAKQFAGVKVAYIGDAVGAGADLDKAAAARFTQDTGIEVNVVQGPQSSTERYSSYQRFFQGQSSDIDMMMVDVIWPGGLATHLLDLNPKLSTEAKQHYPSIIDNDTVNGKLVSMPWFGDFGLLYYRTDLLQKYGFSGPPKTWDELEQQAQKIMGGEQASNPTFTGFVFQGNAYEGLTCDALEWIASSGGGTIIDQSNKVTVNNPQAVAILNKLRGWIGTVAPKGVTAYQEEEARSAFQGGNAAFMRNWPYAYALSNLAESPIKGKFDAAPLPAQPGSKSVGTVGGSQLGVSRYSKNQDAAVEFVRYLTSPEVQTWRAVVGSFVPTISSVADNPEVLKVMPFLKAMADVERVARPSRQTGEQYNQASTAVFQGVSQILGGADAAQVLPQLEQRLQKLIG
jgi:trehalose/maltose transport system substrate-binding protein